MAKLDYPAFDADNHYYEALDAFTRHVPKEMQRGACSGPRSTAACVTSSAERSRTQWPIRRGTRSRSRGDLGFPSREPE